MNSHTNVKIGAKSTKEFIVDEKYSTNHMDGGSTYVLATPAMISYMENTSNFLLQSFLPDGYSNVGTSVNIRHLAATLVGSTVKASSEIVEIDGDKILFKVSVYEGDKLVGDGFHGRHIINSSRFINGVNNN